MCTPQDFSAADSLHSRAVDGQWGGGQQSFSWTSFVLLTLRDRLFAPHHSASSTTSSLYCVSSLLHCQWHVSTLSPHMRHAIGGHKLTHALNPTLWLFYSWCLGNHCSFATVGVPKQLISSGLLCHWKMTVLTMLFYALKAAVCLCTTSSTKWIQKHNE